MFDCSLTARKARVLGSMPGAWLSSIIWSPDV
jgi:hypothetical protein